MSKKIGVLVIWLFFVSMQMLEANYSFKVIVKYPFASEHYDTLGNIVSDSLVRFRPIKPIIFRSETESLYYESIADSGYAFFTFYNWQDNTPISPDNISRMAIDFPRTDRVIEVDGKITFEHLKYSDIDFRRSPSDIEIILPLTVYKDSFTIGSASWINVCNIAVMNDMHIGEGFLDFETAGWNDQDNNMNGNEVTWNNHNVVVAINNLNPDFTIVLGDLTQSGERSEFQRAKAILDELNNPYLPIIGNHDMWPYINYFPIGGEEANIPADCYLGEYFYNCYAMTYESIDSQIPNLQKAPEFGTSPNNYSYYLNLAFDYQNYKFIGVDFNSRNHAIWPNLGILPEADINFWSLNWVTQNVNNGRDAKRKLFIMGHHPLVNRWVNCFSASEISELRNAGLRNYQPLPYWIGGHVHGWAATRIDTIISNSDTVAIAFTLNDACKNGVYGWVSIYDKLYVRIWHTPPDPIYFDCIPAAVNFQTIYSYIGSENSYNCSRWDFGDGTGSYLRDPAHFYHLYDSFVKNFSVTLEVTAANGRKVSTRKIIRVIAMPYDLRTT